MTDLREREHLDGEAPVRDGSDAAPDPRPLGGFAAILATYLVAAAVLVATLKRRSGRLRTIGVRELVLLTLATQHLSRLITKDAVTSPLRSPFTQFVKATGEGEVEEEVVGTGLRHALGDLVTCPFCLSQWVATGLVAGTLALPSLTEAVTVVCALARASDWLQLGYDHLKGDG